MITAYNLKGVKNMVKLKKTAFALVGVVVF